MAERSPATPKSRPPILKRSILATQSSSGALLGSPRRERITLETSKQDEAMAACFLQYCAMCEKQITTPSNSLLYCSEACRRKDGRKPLSAANIMSATTSPTTPPPSSPRSILVPRTPTGYITSTDGSVSRIPADIHSYTSDLDPTEWKPKSIRSSRPTSNRYNSEAFRYLSSFHRAINKNESNDNDTPHEIRFEVPNMNNIAATAPTTPSLGNTPTTTASSWSMSTSAGYDYNNRPLMPRHNRWYSTSVIGGNGADLVTPHIPPPADTYAKKDVMVDTNKKGGLGSFFAGSE